MGGTAQRAGFSCGYWSTIEVHGQCLSVGYSQSVGDRKVAGGCGGKRCGFHIHTHLSPYSYVCFVFCSVFITIFLFSFFFVYTSIRHLCHGAYWCTHNIAHLLILCFLLHFHLCISCVCVREFVYGLPSSSIFIHSYRHIHMFTCFDYSVMNPYKLYIQL